MITIYHNPRCSKSRQTMALIEQSGITPKVVNYLDERLTIKDIKQLLGLLNMTAKELVRSKEQAYKDAGLASEEPSEDALITAMSLYPKLIERPIVVKDNKAIIGRPPENVLSLLPA